MSQRPAVPRVIERQLWAEAMGYCMNPGCQVELIENGVCIGEKAHIRPHQDGGDVSCSNLLLLCPTCHRRVDSSRTDATTRQLKGWKKNRNREITSRFTKQYLSFTELKEAVTPLLERNDQIFDSYGPLSGDANGSERYKLWRQFEGEVIANNQCLTLILTKNKPLLPNENQEIVDSFVTHAQEFSMTRSNNEIQRACLFPQELLSIFGLAVARVGYPPSLSALQNFVSHLIREDCFISLEINKDPCLTYSDEDHEETLSLEDRPRMQQIFWNGKFFRPQSTKVPVRSWVFFAQWLYKTGIEYKFADLNALTVMTLNGKHRIKLCYAYILSLSDLHEMELNQGDMVVNLYNWNGAPISQDAHNYAEQIGVRLFSQNDFFTHAHNTIK